MSATALSVVYVPASAPAVGRWPYPSPAEAEAATRPCSNSAAIARPIYAPAPGGLDFTFGQHGWGGGGAGNPAGKFFRERGAEMIALSGKFLKSF